MYAAIAAVSPKVGFHVEKKKGFSCWACFQFTSNYFWQQLRETVVHSDQPRGGAMRQMLLQPPLGSLELTVTNLMDPLKYDRQMVPSFDSFLLTFSINT